MGDGFLASSSCSSFSPAASLQTGLPATSVAPKPSAKVVVRELQLGSVGGPEVLGLLGLPGPSKAQLAIAALKARVRAKVLAVAQQASQGDEGHVLDPLVPESCSS